MDKPKKWDVSQMLPGPKQPPGRVKKWADRLWAVQWGKDRRNYIRFYPNPGWSLHVMGREWHWCRQCWKKYHKVQYKTR